jgi:hypothetical protein
MEISASRGLILLLLVLASCLSINVAWARLPRPVHSEGLVLAIDLETRTLLLKPAKGKKPFLLDWNKQTEFSANGQSSSAAALKQGDSVVIFYKDLTFHHPLLTRVLWKNVMEAR